jgi:UDP-N-acetylmuramate dehydrogenase
LPSSDRFAPAPGVRLDALCTLGVGGAARWFARATSVDDVRAAHEWAAARGVPLLPLGGGSNLVVGDAGVEGLVLAMGLGGMTVAADGDDTLVTAGAGESWDQVVDAAVERGLSGVECLSGIPGTVGGTPIQNVGAYGQDVARVIDRVAVVDRRDGGDRILGPGECGFGYRASRFKGDDAGRFLVCAVTFRLRPGPPTADYPDLVAELRQAGAVRPSVRDVRRAVLAIRRRKGMVIDPADPDSRSVGSFFLNPVLGGAERERIASAAGEPAPAFAVGDDRAKVPAAWLIERAGLGRGAVEGRAGISSRHTLAIVNRGGASADDVLRLATRVKRAVVERFGVWLRPEPTFVGLDGDERVNFLHRTHG